MGDAPNPNITSSAELEDWNFGDTAAPEGFDPEAKGWEDPPVGWSKFEIPDDKPNRPAFEVEENKSFGGQNPWNGSQLRVRLDVVDGPHAGADIMDFIPLPTVGRPMPATLANRWANFIRSLGFTLTANQIVPPGFKLHQIKKRQCFAEVVSEVYQDKKKLKIKFFGYRPLSDPPPAISSAQSNSGASKKATASTPPVAATQPAVGGLDLDNL